VKGFERPTQWLPLVQAFSQENQMMTPKMSLRRAIITTVYKDKIAALYAGQGNKVIYPRRTAEE
jgi:long-subunit acyl-CoA synthetase (AMP-forming)